VTDWGVGFSLADAPKGHYGLDGIRRRAQLIGGCATIVSQPGRGTRVVVRLPLRDAVSSARAGQLPSSPPDEWSGSDDK
jgi:nitrate/nitrite-specific signal transduction histidine kinase